MSRAKQSFGFLRDSAHEEQSTIFNCEDNNEDLLGLQIRKLPDRDHTAKHPPISDVWGASAAAGSDVFDLSSRSHSEVWTHLEPRSRRAHTSPNSHFPNTDEMIKPSCRSYSSVSVSGRTDSEYQRQTAAGDASSLTSVPSHMETSPNIFNGIDDLQSSMEPMQDTKQNFSSLRCRLCSWKANTRAQKRKHDASHRRTHRCEESGCRVSFGTKNDLERHRKSVHGKDPRCGPTERYKCFGKGCEIRHKMWPRLDNFKAHLERKHRDENPNDLLKMSRDWYESMMQIEIMGETPETSNLDTVSLGLDIDSTPSQVPISPYGSDDIVSGLIRQNETIHNQSLSKSVEIENAISPAREPTDQNNPALALSNVKLPDFRSLVESTNSETAIEPAATNHKLEHPPKQCTLPGVQELDQGIELLKALKAATLQNDANQALRSSCASQVAFEAQDMNDVQTLLEDSRIWFNIISQMQSRMTKQALVSQSAFNKRDVNENNEVVTREDALKNETPRQEGFHCDKCNKVFIRRSTLKKHIQRHQKPYGCTFAGCYGRFGSKADWKRHESMQHYHAQCFRCYLPRGKHAECATLFFQENDFVKHLNEVHDHVRKGLVEKIIEKSRIGTYEYQSQYRFYYWCGFCKQIRYVDKKGVDAYNARFDHIETQHFQKGRNINEWLPAKGHTTKEGCRRRDQIRKQKFLKNQPPLNSGESELKTFNQLHNDNDFNDGEAFKYEMCSSSEDETDIEAKQISKDYIQSHTGQMHGSNEESTVVYCCSCKDGPSLLTYESCIECQHIYCHRCQKENSKGE